MIGFFLFHIIVIPIYWWLYVWPADDACAFREHAAESSAETRGGRDPARLQGAFSIDRLPKRVSDLPTSTVQMASFSCDTDRCMAPPGPDTRECRREEGRSGPAGAH